MNLFSSKADAQKRVPWLQGSDDIPAGVILHFKFIFFVAGVNLHKKKLLATNNSARPRTFKFITSPQDSMFRGTCGTVS